MELIRRSILVLSELSLSKCSPSSRSHSLVSGQLDKQFTKLETVMVYV
jgi:hypothetical protein